MAVCDNEKYSSQDSALLGVTLQKEVLGVHKEHIEFFHYISLLWLNTGDGK